MAKIQKLGADELEAVGDSLDLPEVQPFIEDGLPEVCIINGLV